MADGYLATARAAERDVIRVVDDLLEAEALAGSGDEAGALAVLAKNHRARELLEQTVSPRPTLFRRVLAGERVTLR